MIAIDFHCIYFHTMEVNSYQQLFGSQQQKETDTGWEQKCKCQNFWMNYHFKQYNYLITFSCKKYSNNPFFIYKFNFTLHKLNIDGFSFKKK